MLRKIGIIAVLSLIVAALAAVPALAVAATVALLDGWPAHRWNAAGHRDNNDTQRFRRAPARSRLGTRSDGRSRGDAAAYACQSDGGNFTSDREEAGVRPGR